MTPRDKVLATLAAGPATRSKLFRAATHKLTGRDLDAVLDPLVEAGAVAVERQSGHWGRPRLVYRLAVAAAEVRAA